jgi:hypothetical protein
MQRAAVIAFDIFARVRRGLRRHVRRPKKLWDCVTVVAFYEERESDHDFVDITYFFRGREAFDADELSVHLPRAWDSRWKVEVRYCFRGAKYRAVVRPGEEFAFPPCSEADARSLIPGNGVLYRATLETFDPPGALDVTARVAKYQGVERDYGGRLLKCHDLFPFDDHDHDAERFGTLTIDALSIVGGKAGFSSRTYDYANNEPIFDPR